MMKKLLRLFPVTMFCLLTALILSGCTTNNYTLAEKKKVRAQGRAIMEDYLKTLDGKTRLKDLEANDYLSWESHRRELDGYVYGTFEMGGQSIDFSANTNTGEIFTSEKSEEFLQLLGRAALDRFDVVWHDCDTAGTFMPIDHENENAGRLTKLVPVAVFDDLPAYAESVIGNPFFEMDISVLYTGNPLDFSACSMEDTASFGHSRIQFCLVEEHNLHPADHWRSRDQVLALSSVCLTSRNILMRNYDVSRRYAPYLIHYASHSELLEKDDDENITARSWDMDPDEDIQLLIEGGRIEYYPYSAEQNEEYKDWTWNRYHSPLAPDLYAVIFLEDLSDVDGVDYYLLKDAFKEWVKRNIVEYGDRYVMLDGINSIFVMNCPDVFVFGAEAEKLLSEQEKAGK